MRGLSSPIGSRRHDQEPAELAAYQLSHQVASAAQFIPAQEGPGEEDQRGGAVWGCLQGQSEGGGEAAATESAGG